MRQRITGVVELSGQICVLAAAETHVENMQRQARPETATILQRQLDSVHVRHFVSPRKKKKFRSDARKRASRFLPLTLSCSRRTGTLGGERCVIWQMLSNARQIRSIGMTYCYTEARGIWLRFIRSRAFKYFHGKYL